MLKKADKDVYYYPHSTNACYYCMVEASDASLEALEKNFAEGKIRRNSYEQRILAYYKAKGREKNRLVKLSDYINGSKEQN